MNKMTIARTQEGDVRISFEQPMTWFLLSDREAVELALSILRCTGADVKEIGEPDRDSYVT